MVEPVSDPGQHRTVDKGDALIPHYISLRKLLMHHLCLLSCVESWIRDDFDHHRSLSHRHFHWLPSRVLWFYSLQAIIISALVHINNINHLKSVQLGVLLKVKKSASFSGRPFTLLGKMGVVALHTTWKDGRGGPSHYLERWSLHAKEAMIGGSSHHSTQSPGSKITRQFRNINNVNIAVNNKI